jgi:hypothetical protein
MALTQMQIIQSLGEAMSWFERELEWEVQPTQLPHLIGRIGELYAALITNGQMATHVNQRGYDVVSGIGEKVAVKTTAVMGHHSHISFNANTLDLADRVIILRINTEEMQIETLLNEPMAVVKKIMSGPNVNGKISIPLAKLIPKSKDRSEIASIKTVTSGNYTISELENGTIEVFRNGVLVLPAKPALRELAAELDIGLLNSNGNLRNTRQLGSMVIKAVQVQQSPVSSTL